MKMGKAVTCMLYLMGSFHLLTNLGADEQLRKIEQCPSNKIEWKTRSEEFHCRKNKDRYDCLRIKDTETFIEGCIMDGGNRDLYTKGTYPVYDQLAKRRDTLTCPLGRFQNISYLSNNPGLDRCPHIKSVCIGSGQITLTNASRSTDDAYCKCQNGYVLNHMYQSQGSCIPGTNDCCIENSTDKHTHKGFVSWQYVLIIVAVVLTVVIRFFWWLYVLIIVAVVLTVVIIIFLYVYWREIKMFCRQISCAKESVDNRKIERGETDDDHDNNYNEVCDSPEENDGWVTINHQLRSPVEQTRPENKPFQCEFDLDMLDYSPVPKSGTEPQMDYMTT